MIKTGGTFDPTQKPLYFIASDAGSMSFGSVIHRHLLTAVNELKTVEHLEAFHSWIDSGCTVFVDSGVFNLTMTHARKYELSMDDALAVAPEDLEGFESLFNRYVNLITPVKDRVWGYVEIDAGGRDNKVKTRARLEALGLYPIPVYHPLNDGWDYFDTLASQYDRICFGNVVHADVALRKRLMATLWQRRQQYPGLWVHLLGICPYPLLWAYPVESCDSSSRLSRVRWTSGEDYAIGKQIGKLPQEYHYQGGRHSTAPDGRWKTLHQAAFTATILERNYRYHLNRLNDLEVVSYG